MESKAKILAKGSFLRICTFFLNAAIAFLMMPFVIHSLGDKMYGLWIFIGSFLDFYWLFDLGFSSAVQRYVSRAIGSKNYTEANIIINTSLLLFTFIGISTLSCTILAAFSLPMFVKNITDVTLFRELTIIIGLSFAMSFPMKVFSGILTSSLRYDLVSAISIFKLLFRTLLIIVFLKLGYRIMALALISLVADFVFYIVTYLITKKVTTYLHISKTNVHLSRIRELFKYSIFTFIAQIADKLRFGIDNFVITIFLGLNFVTLYSIASRLMLYFIDFIITAIGILTPVFSQYESRGDYQSLRQKFILTTKISSYLSILIGGILLIFGKAFIIRWVGSKYQEAYLILVILVFPIIIALMQNPSIQLVYGLSKHRFYAVSNSIEGLSNLILSIILVKKFGLVGIALGTAIPMLIVKLLIQPIYTCSIIRLNLRDYYFRILVPISVKATAILTILWLFIKGIIAPTYLKILPLLILTIILFLIITFLFGVKKSEREYLKKIVFAKT